MARGGVCKDWREAGWRGAAPRGCCSGWAARLEVGEGPSGGLRSWEGSPGGEPRRELMAEQELRRGRRAGGGGVREARLRPPKA